MRLIEKPHPREYPTNSQMYMDLIPDDGKVLEHLWNNFIRMKKFVLTLPEEVLIYRKTEWHWSIKETLMHLMDDERIYVYRALRYSRNDKTPLRSYDPEELISSSTANDRTIESIFNEFEILRQSTILFFENLPEDCYTKKISDRYNNYYNSIRAIVYHIAGYEVEQFQSIKFNLLYHEF